MEVVELLARGIKRWSYDGGGRAQRSDDDGAAALCFALLRRGQERAGCEGEMEQAAEACALSLRIGLTSQASAGVQPPHSMPSLPLVNH